MMALAQNKKTALICTMTDAVSKPRQLRMNKMHVIASSRCRHASKQIECPCDVVSC